MVVITRKSGETKDSMFRKFSRLFMDENIVDELRKKQYYRKPSIKKREDAKDLMKARARRKRGRIGFFKRREKKI